MFVKLVCSLLLTLAPFAYTPPAPTYTDEDVAGVGGKEWVLHQSKLIHGGKLKCPTGEKWTFYRHPNRHVVREICGTAPVTHIWSITGDAAFSKLTVGDNETYDLIINQPPRGSKRATMHLTKSTNKAIRKTFYHTVK
jgi:hypothetical protein